MIELNQRGFYSELISNNVDYENDNRTDIMLLELDYLKFKNKKQNLPRAKNPISSNNDLNQELTKNKKQNDVNLNLEKYYSKGNYNINDLADLEPKVMEGYKPIPGRIPRKVKIDRMKKENTSYELNKLFEKENIDLNEIFKNKEWLELELFDDETFDDYNPEEWMQKKGGENNKIPAKGLFIDSFNVTWANCLIDSYDLKAKEFKGQWVENHIKFSYPRIKICFMIENPIKFVKRFKNALNLRKITNSKIYYSCCIDNIPTDDLENIDIEQKSKIEEGLNLKLFKKDKIEEKLNNLKQELIKDASKEYKKSMNKIIFNEYINEANKDLIIKDLIWDDIKKEKVNYKGMIILPKIEKTIVSEKGFKLLKTNEYNEIFKNFCFTSLYTKKEAIIALQEIKKQCLDITKKKAFILEFEEIYGIEKFKIIQEGSIINLANYLKIDWCGKLIQIIKDNFIDIGKGWFNMKETNRLTYDFGKLKRFLTIVRLQMQDSLFTLIKNSLFKFHKFFTKNIPNEVNIISQSEVINHYFIDGKIIKINSNDKENSKIKPFILLDIVKVNNKDEFNYSFKYDKIKKDILELFKKFLDELKVIQDLEPKILDSLHKAKKNETYIMTPILPNKAPEIPKNDKPPKTYPDENKWIWDIYIDIKNTIKKTKAPLDEFKKSFDKYKKILTIKPEEYVSNLENEDTKLNADQIKEKIEYWKEEERKWKIEIPEKIHVSCFIINCKELLRFLLGQYKDINKCLISLLERKAKNTTNHLILTIKDIQNTLKKSPENIDDLTKIKDYIGTDLNTLMQTLKKESKKCYEIYDMLENFDHKLQKEELNKRWILFNGPKEINELIEIREKDLEKISQNLLVEMNENQVDFMGNIKGMQEGIRTFYLRNNKENHEEYKNLVENFKEKLENLDEEARVYNSQELFFNKPVTDYSEIQVMQKDFLPYYNLWKNLNVWYNSYPKWMEDDWDLLDAESSEVFIDDGSKVINQVFRYFRDKNSPEYKDILKVCEDAKMEIEDFKPKVPLLISLKTKGMKERHWKEIEEKTGIKINITENFNFTQVLNLGLLEHINLCCEIGEKAAREYSIELKLKEMSDKWDTIEFELVKHKNTSTYIIKTFEKIEQVLDEHLTLAQYLLVNPFKKPFEEEIDEWYKKLVKVSNIWEEWQKFQNKWRYLQPIFDSPDIIQQLAAESSLFKKVDSNWKNTMSQTKVHRNVMNLCIGDSYEEKFKDSNKNLSIIEKKLNDYLEVKRGRFGRFYFLSNDDLLSILSQTKEVEKIQDHLRKVFENISRLEFDQNKKITAMYSVEMEKIDFIKNVDPSCKQVEDWMYEVENMMIESVRKCLEVGITDYSEMDRNEWILKHSGQTVLNGSQTHWTYEVEKYIKNKSLYDYIEFLEEQLKKLVTINRNGLSKNQYITIEALIVLDVHAKDVVNQLIEKKIDSIGSFEWISQLRYYYEQKENAKRKEMFVKCVQTVFPYGYEYLGNSNRLVITPLTDKCYITLMGAIKLNLGGAPAGPAGTGKTETTKDLAKALAKQCVVFNCQESMNYEFVGQFFKGLASAGAWCCFDEFNRINLEVLSVIAQQLQELFRYKAEDLTEISFEGSNIKMKPTFSIFITMNPGYAGRTELPDNLKALFRPMAMMVPNYALIGEIKLYSFGFLNARELASKMVSTFKLSSEQLSSQSHYDYGMRAVTSVINAAGLLKRNNLDTPEDQILLRALRDVNVPKFLKDDIPLFENIIKDLFPDTEKPIYEYGKLKDSINKSCKELNLQNTNVFINKIYQLYDTIQVRHGLMLVGPTGGGKTSNYNILSKSISALNGIDNYKKINIEIINPKSINMDQLYGFSKEMNWNEGIIEIIVEKAINNQFDPERAEENFWIMFDGPVDALWIESMNTVLDDNKKLCLSSGKVLILSNKITMMFEVEDLLVASPATVSRCGMVYMEPISLGLQPLIDSYLHTLRSNITEHKKLYKRIIDLFNKFLIKTINFVRKNCKEYVSSMDNNLLSSFCKLFNCNIKFYQYSDFGKNKKEIIDKFYKNIDNIFFFTLIWSIGATINNEGRKKFDFYFREITNTDGKKEISSTENIDSKGITSLKLNLTIPLEGKIYEYNLDNKTFEWNSWLIPFNNFEVDFKINYSEIVVPTLDYARNLFLTKLLLENEYHTLTVGPTGTGKSIGAFSLITNNLEENFTSMFTALSAQTNSNQLCDSIFNQIDKRKKGEFGPTGGKKLICFIDDLNMPKKEEYGAQPPIELLRQYLDHKSWYIFKLNKELIKIKDIILLTAMGQPGGGRTEITNRIIRHFNIISYIDLEEDSIKYIFSKILNSFLNKFKEEVKKNIDHLIENTLFFFDKLKNELLPIPSKSHYQFNLRDISNVFQGICYCCPKETDTTEKIIRVWYHENLRVFHDRLINNEDRNYVKDNLKFYFDKFKETKEEIINLDRIIFTDFMKGKEGDRPYVQVRNLNSFKEKLEDLQDDYISDSNKKNIKKLVLFLDACEHIARISRVLKQPKGNMLLLGVGGSGRKSLAKLAIFINNYKLFEIEVVKGYNLTKWREDIKKLIYNTIVDSKPICFLFVDTQIIDEQMIEDVNCLLNTGNIIGLPFNQDEQKKIDDIGRTDCVKNNIPPTKINIFQQQIKRITINSHLCFAMSPLSKEFSNNLRMFPSLINNCNLNWFTEWPEEALLKVGEMDIQEYEEELDLVNVKSSLIEMFKNIHKGVEKITIDFQKNYKRFNYVTPTSFLELLKLFKFIIEKKKKENIKSINRLSNGIEKLKEANENVEKLQIELEKEAPLLKDAEEEVQKVLVIVEKETKEAKTFKTIIQKDEQVAKVSEEEANKIKNEIEIEVKDAEKELKDILKEMNDLTEREISSIGNYSNPPDKVKFLTIGICFLFLDLKDLSSVSPNLQENEFENHFWQLGKKKLLMKAKDTFMKIEYISKNMEKIESFRIKKIKEHLNEHEKRKKTWTNDQMENVSKPAFLLYKFINAIIKFNDTYIKTKPLIDKHEEVKKDLEEKRAHLMKKKEELRVINEKLNELDITFKSKMKLKEDLLNKINICKKKLDIAKKMMDLLGDENSRWLDEIDKLENNKKKIPGNSLISAGIVSYAGPFTFKFREIWLKLWIDQCNQSNLFLDHDTSLKKFLGEEIKIQTWFIAGLPKDDTSIENGIIIDNSKRWPLFIDPQNQANKYIRNLGKEISGIEVIKSNHPNLMKILENSIQIGKWVLIENLGINIDPSLNPLLNKNISESSSGSCTIVLGDKSITYSKQFNFFMATTIPNPHYSPETFAKVTIINFCITPNGLIEQMLATIVILENRQLEDQKNDIVKKNAQDRKILINLEDEILEKLNESEGNLLEDIEKAEKLVDTLTISKKTSNEIKVRVEESKKTEIKIDQARENYRDLAIRCSILFFTIVDLSGIDPMYQYSLQWYENLFKIVVENLPQTNQELSERLEDLKNYFTYSLYKNICRSLFENNKLLFSFLMTIRILEGDNKLDREGFLYLLTGPTGEIPNIPENPSWIAKNSWNNIYKHLHSLNKLKQFNGILEDFMKNYDSFKSLYVSANPQDISLPFEWEERLNSFDNILFLKALRPDKVINSIQKFIEEKMSKKFIDIPVIKLDECYEDSAHNIPIVFILSTGSDPKGDFDKLAEEKEILKVETISLGQGQGHKASKMIQKAKEEGYWVLLQNCHLSASWMESLEIICENLNDANKDFRLWLTSIPSPHFPIPILQNSVKITIEPPQGLRANLKKSFNTFNDKILNDCLKIDPFKKLWYGLCFFHAVIQERRKFGPIGWNIPYEFTFEDLIVSKRQLSIFLNDYNDIPFKVLNFVFSEINYGGRVTDDKDLRLIKSILKNFCSPEVLKENYKFSESGYYINPPSGTQKDYLNSIENLPYNPSPEVFGLHDNADISNAENNTFKVLNLILSLQSKGNSGVGKTDQEVIQEVIDYVKKKLPKVFNYEEIVENYPTMYEESMNTVLTQEVLRYNNLLKIMNIQLVSIQKALKGEVVMSEELEKMTEKLKNQQVPNQWEYPVGFLSLKPLNSWIEELDKRIKFFNEWITKGKPKIFWFSGFFFPQAFITGIMQNYSRKNKIAIDRISFKFKILNQKLNHIKEPPSEGIYVDGIFIEGASWNYQKNILSQPIPKELFSSLPIIWLKPKIDRVIPKEGIYNCPLYKVTSRSGTLLTTGHSTNFIMYFELPSKENEDIWIKGGCAAFLSLKY